MHECCFTHVALQSPNPSAREDLMPFPVRTLRAAALAVLVAVSLAGCGDDNNSPPATPPAPTGLTATVADDGSSIAVSWTAVTGATSYTLERADAPSSSFAAIGGTLTTTSFTDAAITPGASYSYHVAAVNGSGTGTFSTTVNATVAGAKVATLTGNITADRTLYADTTYTLSGY